MVPTLCAFQNLRPALALGALLLFASLSPPESGGAQAASARRDRVICTMEYRPVCGRRAGRLKTYGNACAARAAGARIVAHGPCGGAR